MEEACEEGQGSNTAVEPMMMMITLNVVLQGCDSVDLQVDTSISGTYTVLIFRAGTLQVHSVSQPRTTTLTFSQLYKPNTSHTSTTVHTL
jgi:hypothetical protein